MGAFVAICFSNSMLFLSRALAARQLWNSQNRVREWLAGPSGLDWIVCALAGIFGFTFFAF